MHGGQALALARELGCRPEAIRDFSASLNPLGPPPAALAAAQAALADAAHYPEADAAALARALARLHHLPPGCVLAGAGATEFIFLLPRILRPRRALLVEPAFGEYRPALEQADVLVDSFRLDPATGFHLDPAVLLAALHPSTDLVWLANPLNPSGTGYPPAILNTLLDGLPPEVKLVVDEAFIDFSPEQSLLERVPAASRLIVLRSLTKFYAIAGLRVGWLAAPPPLAARLAAGREPWRLSTPALAAGLACVDAATFRADTMKVLPEWRAALADGLAALGCAVFPSVANYLLCRLPDHAPAASAVAAALRPLGILVRPCEDFAGLDARYMRLAVRPLADTRLLLAELAKMM